MAGRCLMRGPPLLATLRRCYHHGCRRYRLCRCLVAGGMCVAAAIWGRGEGCHAALAVAEPPACPHRNRGNCEGTHYIGGTLPMTHVWPQHTKGPIVVRLLYRHHTAVSKSPNQYLLPSVTWAATRPAGPPASFVTHLSVHQRTAPVATAALSRALASCSCVPNWHRA